MTLLLRSVAVAAAALCFAAPAFAQSVNTSQRGTYGSVELRTGFTPDPHSTTVTAGGDVDASTVNSSCNGHIARRPDFTLRYTAGDTLPLIISASSDGDTTLAIYGPDRQWTCNDDGNGNGLNPLVRYDHPRSGRYQIFIGTFSEEPTPAMLHISEVGAGGTGNTTADNRPDFTLEPAYGSIDLTSGFQPDPHTVAISAGGEADASTLGQGCTGHVARAPDYRVNWTAGSGALPLIFSVSSDADTTLVVNDAAGNWICDDDSGNAGLNPSITIQNPGSGQYDVWVGTFTEGDLQQSTLNVSELTSQ